MADHSKRISRKKEHRFDPGGFDGLLKTQREDWVKGKNKELSNSQKVKKAWFRKNINLDISARCTLACPRCRRQEYVSRGMPIPGHDLSIDDFKKIANHFNIILFCGQISDPCIHPKFHEILKICCEKEIVTAIATATSHRPMGWYKKAFEIHPKAYWRFGMDGLPEESCLYRINQDGEKLWEIMKMGVSMGMDVEWQYIVFSYNEDHIEQAQQMAKDNGITFLKVISSRWKGNQDGEDPYQPIDKKYFISGKHFHTPKKKSNVKVAGNKFVKTLFPEEKWLSQSTLGPWSW